MPEIPETIGPRAGASPVSVELTELGTVDVEGSFAHFDGTGASGSWLAALTIRSQNGAILSRVWPSTTLAAGDTADVTYVPLSVEAASGSSLTFAQGMILLGATNSLLGWWRLGDGPTTWADSNPYQTACDLTTTVTGAALTPHITGALAGSQDDGAVQFNGWGTTAGDYLSVGGACGTRFGLPNNNFSVAAWVKPTFSGTPGDGGAVSNMSPGATSNQGWALQYRLPDQIMFFIRQQDGGLEQDIQASVATGVWSFVVGTYSTSAGMKLYVNGALQDSDAGTFNSGSQNIFRIGAMGFPIATLRYFGGGVDEVSVWGSVLSATDILNLYTYGITA